MFKKSTLKKMKKDELIYYCISLQNDISKLKKEEQKKSSAVLNKNSTYFNILGYNSTSGIKLSGESYKKATLFIHNNNGGNCLTLKVEFYVPSGYGDGSLESLQGEYVLTQKDIQDIYSLGFRTWCKSFFQIPKYIEKYNMDFGKILESLLK